MAVQRKYESIRYRFLKDLSTILFISTVVLSTVIAVNEGRILNRSLITKGRSFASYIAMLSSDPLIMKDDIRLDSIVSDASKDEDILYTVIHDANGSLTTSQFASINYRSPRLKAILAGLPKESDLQDIIDAIRKKEAVTEVSVPVFSGQYRIGEVTICLSQYAIRRQILNTVLFILALNIAMAIILGYVVFFVSRRALFKPLAELAGATDRLAKGDLTARITLQAADELQVLFDNFNRMAGDLDKTTVSKSYMDNIIEGMINTLIVADQEDKIIRANAAACSLLGYREEELKGNSIDMILVGNESEKYSGVKSLPSDQRTSMFEASYRAKGGQMISVLLSVSVLYDKKNIHQSTVFIAQDFTERKLAEKALRESEAQYRVLFEGSPDAILLADPETGVILDANPAASQLLARTQENIVGLHQSKIHPPHKESASRDIFTQHIEGAREQKRLHPSEMIVLRPDGSEVSVEVLAQLVTIRGKKVLQGVFRDITERKIAEQQLEESIDRFRRLSEAGFEGIIISDLGSIVDANTRMAEMLACKFTDLIGRKISDFVAPQSLESVENHIQSGSEERYELLAKRKDGSIFPVEAQGRSLPYEGRTLRISAIRDITDRKAAEKRISYLAYYDSLTGLPNRTLYKELVNRALFTAQRHHSIIAILFIDLDYFKRINDTLGHDVGDQLLRTVGDLIKTCIRKDDFIARSEEDKSEMVVARLGGDEFIVLLHEIAHAQDASRVARRILQDLAQPFTLAGHEVFITASIGIAVYPLDGDDADSLLKNADVAMYHAKNQGRDNYQFYTKSMNATALQRLDLENDLRKALDRGEFQLFYQPTVNVKTRMISGVEALIRWNHPSKGMISPGEFIPLAEETGLIVPMGEWVLRTACIQNKTWQEAGNKPFSVAVNLSGRQFDQEGLIEAVSNALRDSRLDPQYLELEMTESTIMKNPEKAATTLHKLKGMGICLSLDDFGTGYSSLGNLRKFPLDTLKIDRSFVMNIPANNDDAAITTAIIAMAHSLKLDVIAEGVESEDQHSFLHQLECDAVQGYLFSRPLPAEEFIKLVREDKQL